MKKFIHSQIKTKDERREEKEINRREREQEKAVRDAEKAEVVRQNGGPQRHIPAGPYGSGLGRWTTGETTAPASGAEFDSRPHRRHFSDRRIANPAPLGLFAFSFSFFLLGLIELRAQGLTQTAALTGPFLMYSSIMMGITAIFELIAGNTFGATAFGTFAGFFLSLGALLLPSFGTFDNFTTNPLQLYNFLGLFYATWLIPFGIFCFLTIRSTWTLWLQFIFIFVYMALSCAQYLNQNSRKLALASGAILIVVAFFGYLNGAAGLMAKETVFFQPPALQMPWAVPAGLNKKRRSSVEDTSSSSNHPANTQYNTAPYQESQLNRSDYHDIQPVANHEYIQPVPNREYVQPQPQLDDERFIRREQPVSGLAPPIISTDDPENRMSSIDLHNDRI